MPRNRKIVSPKEYLAYLARKTFFESGFFLLALACGVCSILALLGFFAMLVGIAYRNWSGVLALIFTILMGLGAYWFYKGSVAANDQSCRIEPVYLPSRHYIDELSVEETLVRASQQPTPEPAQSLLRPAQNSAEIKPGELLRPLQ